MLNSAYRLRFGALICHNPQQKRCPESGVRIFNYELTNDTTQYPLGWVVSPESGESGSSHPAVALAAQCLPHISKLPLKDRLCMVRKLIRLDSQHWKIGKHTAEDISHEYLASRGKGLLKDSTATIRRNPNGSLSMFMEYKPALRMPWWKQLFRFAQTHSPLDKEISQT